jgi:phage gpG-like protein
MDTPAQLIQNILSDVRVELLDEFDRNFQRKAFFTAAWQRRKVNYGKGSLMIQSGTLRRSIRAKISGQTLSFMSSTVYGAIHNEGGKIRVTRKMKRFFWAMYYKYGGHVKTLKSGRKSAMLHL